MTVRLGAVRSVRRRVAPRKVKQDELGVTEGDLRAIDEVRKKQVARAKKKANKRRKKNAKG